METATRRPNWFVRVLIILLTISLAVMVRYNFVEGNPSYQISAGAITIVLIITVLVLAEAFDSLSIGKMLSLSREVQKKEERNKDLNQENNRLRENLIQITSNYNQQSQVNATINGLTTDGLRALLGVTSATSSEAESEKTSHADEEEIRDASENRVSYFLISRRLEVEALNKYVSERQLEPGAIVRDVKFTPSFQGLDPIADRPVVFDGYMKSALNEQFFEVAPRRSFGLSRWDKIYVMLSKILHYGIAKKIPAKLVLLIADHPNGERPPMRDGLPRFEETFQPALKAGLLEIVIVEFSQEEMKKIEEDLKNK